MNNKYILPTRWPSLAELEEAAAVIPEVDPLSVYALNKLLDVAREMESALDKDLSRYGLSLNRYSILWTVVMNKEKGVTPAEIAEYMGVTRATITGLLDGLEKDGYVKRVHRSDDRRKISIIPKPKAGKLLADIYPDHISRVAKSMSGLLDREKKQLHKLLGKVVDGAPALEEEVDGTETKNSKAFLSKLFGVN